MTSVLRPDLNNRQSIDQFVDHFYQKILSDDRLAPLFTDVANIDLATHLPHIKNYWCKLLLGDSRYQRHTMNIHRQLNSRHALSAQDFQHWLKAFEITLDERFFGPKTDQARSTARSIAKNMKNALCSSKA